MGNVAERGPVIKGKGTWSNVLMESHFNRKLLGYKFCTILKLIKFVLIFASIALKAKFHF